MAEAQAPAPAAPAPTQTSGSEAAAILLMLLGDNEAADVLSRLDPAEVQHLGAAMFNVAAGLLTLNVVIPPPGSFVPMLMAL